MDEIPDSSGPRQLVAHPDFAAHFTSAIYDPYDPANDETAPFGGDEGADVYAEWSERFEEIAALTLRDMLELDDDTATSKSAMADLDDITIAAAFVHLRATGWIDREGALWLRAALTRSDRDNPDAEFATMLQDLATYSNHPPKVRRPRRERGWLRIHMGAGDGPLTRWSRVTEEGMAADTAWSSWWTSTPFAALDFHPGFYNPRAEVDVSEEGGALVVLASKPRLTRAARSHFGVTITSDSPPLPSLMTVPDVREMLDDLLLAALRTAAMEKGLAAPPAHLPQQSD